MKMRVMIARRRYKDKVYETPLVVTSYRDDNGVSRNRTVLNLTGLPRHAVEAVRVALREGPDATPAGVPVRYSHSIPVGAAHAVVHLLRDIGIAQVLENHLPPKQFTAVLAMIVQRVTGEKAASKRRLCDDFVESGLALLRHEHKGPALKAWYQALDTLESARSEILTALFPKRGRLPRLFLYDITSSYFEGTHCPLARFGYNRDGKKGKMQIVIGLMTDHEGKPVWVQVFEGNTADQTNVLEQIKLLRDTLGIQELVFVGDRGMLTHSVIEDMEGEFDERKIDYITALKRQEMMELVDRQDHPIQPELFDEQELCEVWEGPVRYVLCHNPDRRERDAQMRERLLSKTEAKLQSIQNNVASGRIKRRDVIMKRLFRWLNKWKMERFFQVDYDEGRFEYRRDAEAIQRYSRLDGCYVVKSNVCLDAMDKDEVASRYKSLKHVEQAFRTMKTTELETRPIRHWTPSRVQGHVFMCFLAYRVIYEARKRWASELERDPITRECDGDSLREMWATLDRITAGYVSVANETVCQVGRITPVQKHYLEELRVPVQIHLGRE
jgi:hypothetical protein